MKTKKFVAYVLSLCMLLFASVAPSSAANLNKGIKCSAVYVMERTESGNVVVKRSKPSLIKRIGTVIGETCVAACAVVVAGCTWCLSKEAVRDLYNGRPLTRDVFRRAWNNFNFSTTLTTLSHLVNIGQNIRNADD